MGVFTPETILVESPGMQHWVSMQLATEHGVAMNIDYPLPVRFMWNTARTVLGQESKDTFHRKCLDERMCFAQNMILLELHVYQHLQIHCQDQLKMGQIRNIHCQ